MPSVLNCVVTSATPRYMYQQKRSKKKKKKKEERKKTHKCTFLFSQQFISQSSKQRSKHVV